MRIRDLAKDEGFQQYQMIKVQIRIAVSSLELEPGFVIFTVIQSNEASRLTNVALFFSITSIFSVDRYCYGKGIIK